MLLRLDALAQAFNRVVWPHPDAPLGEDRPLVDILGHHVDGAAGFGDAGVERNPDRVHGAGELGKQGRMDVDDPPLEFAGEGPFQDRVIARADDQLDTVLAKLPHHFPITRLAIGKGRQTKHLARDAGLLRDLERRALTVGTHHHDTGGIEWIFCGLDQGLQVAAPARNQDANPEPAHSRIWTRRCADATMSPTTNTSPSRIRSAVAALASSTTTIIPIPILKVRHISSSGVKGAR